ncbi:putative substrate-binding transporter protein [Sulfitobacter mediterraneus KCTC 32188]|nr:putative substrate-binding transporter protein [Sulfitobacter mediterraneus KCTC 32188]
MGQIGLSFHKAAGAVIAAQLERLGHNVLLREAPHEDMFRMLGEGEVDLVCSAWLPDSHGAYIAPFEDELTKLGVIYRPYCIWGIPDSAPAEIASVTDLAEPEIAALFRKRIQGINPGAGISRFSRQMVADYGLSDLGFHFENGTVEDCTGAALDAVDKGELAVVPLWHPQWLHQELDLRELDDPLGLLGGQDDATLVLRRDAVPKLNGEGLAYLQTVNLGNDAVSQLDHLVCREGRSFTDAAQAWLGNNS